MSNKYFSYSFQIHRTRKTIIIFIIFVIILVGGFLLFYKSKKHSEKLNDLTYEVVLGMNEFEDNNCNKSYRVKYKESTCGTICINALDSDTNYLIKTKEELEKGGFTIDEIKQKQINKRDWSYFITTKANPVISHYAIDYDNKLYSVEVINQSKHLPKSKRNRCEKMFNKMTNSLSLK